MARPICEASPRRANPSARGPAMSWMRPIATTGKKVGGEEKQEEDGREPRDQEPRTKRPPSIREQRPQVLVLSPGGRLQSDGRQSPIYGLKRQNRTTSTFLANPPFQGNGSHWGPLGRGRWGIFYDCPRAGQSGQAVVFAFAHAPGTRAVTLRSCSRDHAMATRPSYTANAPRPLPLWMQEGCADVYSSDAFRHVPPESVWRAHEKLRIRFRTRPSSTLLTRNQVCCHCSTANPACGDRIAPEPLPRKMHTHDPNPRCGQHVMLWCIQY